MSRKIPSPRSAKRLSYAPVFAALGDRTRLALVKKLSQGELYSISELTQGSRLTRQAITKHLRVLEHAGMVRRARKGRESIFAFDPEPLHEAKNYLESVSVEWDHALNRLKMFVEEEKPR
jgi:DNA-binding transcriptional ArsR family regulator